MTFPVPDFDTTSAKKIFHCLRGSSSFSTNWVQWITYTILPSEKTYSKYWNVSSLLLVPVVCCIIVLVQFVVVFKCQLRPFTLYLLPYTCHTVGLTDSIMSCPNKSPHLSFGLITKYPCPRGVSRVSILSFSFCCSAVGSSPASVGWMHRMFRITMAVSHILSQGIKNKPSQTLPNCTRLLYRMLLGWLPRHLRNLLVGAESNKRTTAWGLLGCTRIRRWTTSSCRNGT